MPNHAGMADRTTGGPVNRPRAADDFETIRARIEELRRGRERMEGWPPPWVPMIFVKKA
jgi:hypothetical protein